MGNKILSVVVPTYNMEQYLDRCLSSLIIDDEHMRLLEVLVINDGSKDRSSEIAHDYEARYPATFVAVDKSNGNYGSCVNCGLDMASGTYVKILDADDWFDNDNLTSFLDFLAHTDADWVISYLRDRHMTDEMDLPNVDSVFNRLPETTFDISDMDDDIVRSVFIHAVTYRTERLREIGYRQLEGISYTDLQWITEPMMNVNKGGCFHKVMYNYFIGREGQTVDGTVHCRNMWMEHKVILHVAEKYKELRDRLTDAQNAYMSRKILFMSEKVYDNHLIQFPGKIPNDSLCDFDSQLKILVPEIYSKLDECALSAYGVKFRYVKDWRRHKARKSFMFLIFDMYAGLRRLVKS